jgi:LysR family glycine cleavage system transcriptional activator
MGDLSMKRNLPPLNWLRSFEVSARHLSFTSAAGELNLTQAAVSKQIKMLEQYLGEELFHRKARSLALTKTGAAYVPKVRDAIERLAAGTEEVFGNRRSESLTIRVPVGFSVNWLGPRLHGYYRHYPDKPIRVLSSVWSDAFDTERFDLDIRYGSGNWPGFHADRLTWETLRPMCSPALAAGIPSLRTPGDLQYHTLLHVLGYEEGWVIWLKAAGIDDVNPGRGLQFDTSLVAFEVAAQGAGIALGRSSMSEGELKSGRLVAPFDVTAEIDEAFHLVSPMDGIAHPDTNPFRDWLIGEARSARQR